MCKNFKGTPRPYSIVTLRISIHTHIYIQRYKEKQCLVIIHLLFSFQHLTHVGIQIEEEMSASTCYIFIIILNRYVHAMNHHWDKHKYIYTATGMRILTNNLNICLKNKLVISVSRKRFCPILKRNSNCLFFDFFNVRTE